MENSNQPSFLDQKITSVGEWIVTFILMGIPVVGFIMLCVWAFGNNTSPAKANFAKAALIMMVIGFVLVILFWGVIGAMFASAF
ncbi:MAG: hypothetical protein LUH15_00925 [Tannerellaceae bacterium]|nr:hypothetical protein [Tannerellaceae bacterium]